MELEMPGISTHFILTCLIYNFLRKHHLEIYSVSNFNLENQIFNLVTRLTTNKLDNIYYYVCNANEKIHPVRKTKKNSHSCKA